MNNLKVMDLPENERPRERLLKYGAEVLSNSELIAVILNNGSHSENVIALSSRVLKEIGGLNGILALCPQDIIKLRGIGNAKAARLIAVSEIAKRIKSFMAGESIKVTNPGDAAGIVMESMKNFNSEHLRVIMLNVKNIVISVKDVSIGSINEAIVHPREIFVEAIKNSSASIILCHNHPSGDPTPSTEDINITKRLKECSKLIGIELLDHIIIGEGIYVSLKEKGVI